MSQVAGWITHRYLKFAVIVFWLVVVALLGPLAGKLTGAQNNDATVLAARQRRVDAGARRRSGVPVLQHDPRGHRLRARRAASPPPTGPRPRSDAAEFAALGHARRRGHRPDPVARTARRCRSSSRSTSARTAGTTPPTPSTTMRDHRRRRPGRARRATSPARPATPPTRPTAFEGIDGTLLLRGPRRSSSSSCCSPTAARSSGCCR